MRFEARSTHLLLIAVVLYTTACGEGGGTGGVQPPPPSPDFSLALSATSLTVALGRTSSPVNISVTAQNGFSSTVEMSISGLPSGVSTNPPSPFAVAPGQSVSVLFDASSDASTGQFNLTTQAASGSLSHSRAHSHSEHGVHPTN